MNMLKEYTVLKVIGLGCDMAKSIKKLKKIGCLKDVLHIDLSSEWNMVEVRKFLNGTDLVFIVIDSCESLIERYAIQTLALCDDLDIGVISVLLQSENISYDNKNLQKKVPTIEVEKDKMIELCNSFCRIFFHSKETIRVHEDELSILYALKDSFSEHNKLCIDKFDHPEDLLAKQDQKDHLCEKLSNAIFCWLSYRNFTFEVVLPLIEYLEKECLGEDTTLYIYQDETQRIETETSQNNIVFLWGE
jgi:hypothetical protein